MILTVHANQAVKAQIAKRVKVMNDALSVREHWFDAAQRCLWQDKPGSMT